MAEGYLACELILLVSLIWFEQQLPDVCVDSLVGDVQMVW